MANQLTKKRKGFVKDYAETGNGTLAAKKNFDVTNDNSAAATASRALKSVKVQEVLEDLGFNEINAKKVVVEIMHNKRAEPNARLKATDQVFKVKGSYAPEKSQSVNLNVAAKLEDTATEALRKEYEAKLKAKLAE